MKSSTTTGRRVSAFAGGDISTEPPSSAHMTGTLCNLVHKILPRPSDRSVETATISGEGEGRGRKAKERYRPHFVSNERTTFALQQHAAGRADEVGQRQHFTDRSRPTWHPLKGVHEARQQH